MMETLLSYGEDAKRTQLTSALFYKDRAGRINSVDLEDNAANDGLLKRRALGLESRTFDMMGRLHAEKLFSGQLPTRIVIVLVDNRAYNGDRQRNPFNF